MNYRDYLIEKLKSIQEHNIIITPHAKEQALFRSIDLEEVKDNILRPQHLAFAGKQKALHTDEEKFDCYFAYGDRYCHRYIIIVNGGCIICTVIKIHRQWQKMVERYANI